jgi:hypothetical protein
MGGHAYVVGTTRSSTFPIVNPVPEFTSNGLDPFLAKLDSSGSTLHYSTYLGRIATESLMFSCIAVDEAENVYITGATDAQDFPTVNPFQEELYGASDALILKISTVERPTDIDADGVADSVEDSAPNNGDGNQDAVLDSAQGSVASLPDSVTGSYVTLAVPEGTSLASVVATGEPSPTDTPPGVSFPLGFFEFSIEGINPGSATTVKLFLPANIRVNSYYKYGPTPQDPDPHWYEFLFDGTTGAEILPDRVVLHFVDGQRGDDDLTANGEITEPGGPAQILSSFFFPQFADGVWETLQLQFQSTLILVNPGADSLVRIELYKAPDGVPMVMTLGDLGTDSAFEFELKQGESISLATPGTGDLQVGYARVSAGEGVEGVVVFRRSDLSTGISLYEAGVPASTLLKEFSIFVDSLGVRDTGFAIVYPPEEGGNPPAQVSAANVTIRLYDTQYNFIAEKTLDPLAPGSHLSRFVYEMFDDLAVKVQAQEMEGILVVKSDQPLVAVTVRQNDDPIREFPQEVPILTTFPVIPGAPE